MIYGFDEETIEDIYGALMKKYVANDFE